MAFLFGLLAPVQADEGETTTFTPEVRPTLDISGKTQDFIDNPQKWLTSSQLILDAMKLAATEYPRIIASRLRIQANELRSTGRRLDRFSVGGSVSRSWREGETNGEPSSSTSSSESVSVSFSFTPSSVFSNRGFDLRIEAQEATHKALQMRTSIEMLSAYLRLGINISVVYFLQPIQEEVKTALETLPLNDDQRSRLGVTFSSLNTASAQARAAYESAKSEFLRLVDKKPVSLFEIYERADRDPRVLNDILLNEINFTSSIFPGIPETVEDAQEQARATSTSVVLADISEKRALNSWRLTLAENLPSFSISLSHGLSDLESSFGEFRSDTESLSTTISARLSVNIGAGTAHHLSAAELDREAAHYDAEATLRESDSQLATLYRTLESSRRTLPALQASLLRSYEQVERIRADGIMSGAGFNDNLKSINGFQLSLAGLAQNYQSFLLTQAQVLSATGQLLTEIGIEE
ncbi:MAG: TolC family protein [Pseudomonadota bacterium]